MCCNKRHAGRAAQQKMERRRNVGKRAGGNQKPSEPGDGVIAHTVIIIGVIGLDHLGEAFAALLGVTFHQHDPTVLARAAIHSADLIDPEFREYLYHLGRLRRLVALGFAEVRGNLIIERNLHLRPKLGEGFSLMRCQEPDSVAQLIMKMLRQPHGPCLDCRNDIEPDLIIRGKRKVKLVKFRDAVVDRNQRIDSGRKMLVTVFATLRDLVHELARLLDPLPIRRQRLSLPCNNELAIRFGKRAVDRAQPTIDARNDRLVLVDGGERLWVGLDVRIVGVGANTIHSRSTLGYKLLAALG
jgi:hypothetical protein